MGAVDILQKLRDHFEKKVTVTSGCRCLPHHKAIYKKLKKPYTKKSLHLASEGCKATDVVVEDVSPQLVAEAAIQYGATGVKNYKSFTHIDVRDGYEWIRVTEKA